VIFSFHSGLIQAGATQGKLRHGVLKRQPQRQNSEEKALTNLMDLVRRRKRGQI